jgi:uncharacterized iron-regulated membrane protein
VAALGGVLLWLSRRTGRWSRKNPQNIRLRLRRVHGLIGVSVGLACSFFPPLA